MRKILVMLLFLGMLSAEVRIYRQVSDVAAKQTGRIEKSNKQEDLYEFTYEINQEQNLVVRTAIRRLDQEMPVADATRYKIMSERNLIRSSAGSGGPVITAVAENGSEIIQLGEDFAFTSRTSDFSQMITGVYRRQ